MHRVASAAVLCLVIAACDVADSPMATQGVGAAAFSNRPAKVAVCHYDVDAGTFHKITVPEPAVDDHLAHGDGLPGDPLPDDSGVFGLDCSPIHPAIEIVKLTNGTDNNSPPGLLVPVGSTVTWTYRVRNTGDVPLSNIVVTDDNGTPSQVADDFSPTFATGDTNSNGVLDPLETWTYTAARVATAGQYANTGTAVGTSPDGTEVQDSDVDHHFGET